MADPFASMPEQTAQGQQPPTTTTTEDQLSIQSLRNEEAIQAALPGVCMVSCVRSGSFFVFLPAIACKLVQQTDAVFTGAR